MRVCWCCFAWVVPMVRKYGYDTPFTVEQLLWPLAKHLLDKSDDKTHRRLRLERIEEKHGKDFADRVKAAILKLYNERR